MLEPKESPSYIRCFVTIQGRCLFLELPLELESRVETPIELYQLIRRLNISPFKLQEKRLMSQLVICLIRTETSY